MEHSHPAAVWLMVVLSAAAAACCLAAGRTVPWQGRQAALTMAGGMTVLAVAGGAVATIAVAGVWVVSAMLGTAGLRGRPEAADCCHRAVGSLAMALCLFAGGHEPAASGPHAHGMGLPVLAAVAVGGITLWTVVGRRHRVTAWGAAGRSRGEVSAVVRRLGTSAAGRSHGSVSGRPRGAVAGPTRAAALPRATTSRAAGLLRAEAWAMTAGLVLMYAAHALPA